MNTLERRGAQARAPMNKRNQTERHDAACKQQTVENWIKTGQPGTPIAGELGLRYPSLKEGTRRYSGDTNAPAPRSGGGDLRGDGRRLALRGGDPRPVEPGVGGLIHT